MKTVFSFLILSFYFLSCQKESNDQLSLLTREPWKIDKYTKTIFIDNKLDTIYTIPDNNCDHYGTIFLNDDFSGRFVSICNQTTLGGWKLQGDVVDLILTPIGITVSGFVFPNAKIKVLNKTHLVLESKFVVTGIDPVTNKLDTLIRLENLYMSH